MKARFTDHAVTLYDGDRPLYQLTHAAARELFGSLAEYFIPLTGASLATKAVVEWTKPIGTANEPDSAKFAYPTGVLS